MVKTEEKDISFLGGNQLEKKTKGAQTILCHQLSCLLKSEHHQKWGPNISICRTVLEPRKFEEAEDS